MKTKLVSILTVLVIVSFISFSAIPTKADTNCDSERNAITCSDNNPYNGYWWYNYWIPGMVSQASRMTPMPVLTVGNAVIYAPGLMEATGEFRNMYNYKTGKYVVNGVDGGWIGGVATEVCSEIGTSVWLKRPGGKWEGAYLVVDCARRNYIYGQIVGMGLVTEIDFNTALRWGMATATDATQENWSVKVWRLDGVQVSKIDPRCLGNQKPVNIVDWFKSIITYAQPKTEMNFVYYSPSTWLLDGKLVTYHQTGCYNTDKKGGK
jgi:hypothetical protein